VRHADQRADQERRGHQQREVFDEAAQEVAGQLYMPDEVEAVFHLFERGDQRPDQREQADR
jgi:hypothetical protein